MGGGRSVHIARKPFLALGLLLFCGRCNAVDPYDNVALSQGWWLSFYPTYYSASTLTDKNGKALATDPNAKTYQTVLRANYYERSLLPVPLGFTVAMPAGKKELLGDADTGFGDLTVAAGAWIIDDPAANFGQATTSHGTGVPVSGIRRYQAGPSIYWTASKKLSLLVNALFEFDTKNTSEGRLLMSRLTWRL